MNTFGIRWTSSFKEIVPVSTALFYVVFVSFSFVLFNQNLTEFHSGYLSIAQHAVFPSLIGILGLSAIIAILPEIVRLRAQALLVVSVALSYVQGTFLVSNYGPLNGEPIDWQAFATKSLLEGSLWLVVISAALIFAPAVLKRQKTILSFVFLASTFGLLSVVLGGEVRLFTPPQPTRATESFRFSPEKNVLEIILDSFSTPAFEAIIKDDAQLREVFNGFTNYQNTLTSFTTTAPSIPSILTGLEYDNSETMKVFLNRAFGELSIPALLDKNGLDVTIMSLPQLCSRISQSCASLGKAVAADATKIAKQELLEILDLSLFRAVPQGLKKIVYNDEHWFFQSIFSRKGSPSSHYNSLRFAEVFENNAIVNAEKPTYKFFHLMLPHAPFIFDAECKPVEKGKKYKTRKEPYQAQGVCALKQLARMIETLKKQGIFEKTMIIAHADHGYSVRYLTYEKAKELPILEQAMPLLLIKPFGVTAEKEIAASKVPARLIDISATIADSLGINVTLPGQSVFRLAPETDRVRTYREYGWHNDFWGDAYLPKMQEWEVRGDVRDGNAWKRGRRLAPPK